MLKSVRTLFEEAQSNKEFELSMMNSGEKTPKWWWSTTSKITYAAIYMGWLIGRGQYDRTKYKNNG